MVSDRTVICCSLESRHEICCSHEVKSWDCNKKFKKSFCKNNSAKFQIFQARVIYHLFFFFFFFFFLFILYDFGYKN